MNGFSKNKGLIIELTSLLDVILIMLFWVMMNSSGKAEEAENNARRQIEEANAEVTRIEEETSEKLDEMSEYVKTVEGFENGEMLSISITYDNGSDLLTFQRAGEELSSFRIDGGVQVEDEIRKVLDDLSQGEDKVILAALIYDGNAALYRDVKTVREALESLRSDYESVYFAYINTGTAAAVSE